MKLIQNIKDEIFKFNRLGYNQSEIGRKLNIDRRIVGRVLDSHFREKQLTYYTKNKKRILAKDKEYALKNKDKIAKYAKEYRDKNKLRLAEEKKLYYRKNKEKILRKDKIYYEENKKRIIENVRKRYNSDIQFKIKTNLKNRLREVLNGKHKSAKTLELLGCSIEEFKKHLESLWLPGMSWNNHSLKGWHIDHIKPCAKFDLSKPEEQRECFHWSNMQPLWAFDNLSKNDNIL